MATLAEIWRKPRGFAIDVLPTVFYLAVLFWACLAPFDSLPGPDFEFVDKVWHFGAFAGLTGLLARSLRHAGRPLALANRDAALFSAGLGALLEALQSLTRFRAAEVADLVADCLGALVAYWVLRRLT